MALLGEMRERTQNLLDPKPQMDSIRGSGQGTPSPGGQARRGVGYICHMSTAQWAAPKLGGHMTAAPGAVSPVHKVPSSAASASGGTKASAICPISSTLSQLSPCGHSLLPDLGLGTLWSPWGSGQPKKHAGLWLLCSRPPLFPALAVLRHCRALASPTSASVTWSPPHTPEQPQALPFSLPCRSQVPSRKPPSPVLSLVTQALQSCTQGS